MKGQYAMPCHVSSGHDEYVRHETIDIVKRQNDCGKSKWHSGDRLCLRCLSEEIVWGNSGESGKCEMDGKIWDWTNKEVLGENRRPEVAKNRNLFYVHLIGECPLSWRWKFDTNKGEQTQQQNKNNTFLYMLCGQ